MLPFHALKRPLLVLAAAVIVVGLAPMPTLSAHSEGFPSTIRFPQDPTVTEFSSTFGAPRSGGRRHKGTDLMAPRLTEVYSVADGEVIFVGRKSLSGRTIRIAHDGGWTSHYVHLNNDNPGKDDGKAPWSLTVAPGVEEGTTVEAGQLIGWVGDSGNAEHTAPHTHFELRRNGTAINPYHYLVEAQRRDLSIIAEERAEKEAKIQATLEELEEALR